jgi:2-hydroxychromene-2-carboxylate isomerase
MKSIDYYFSPTSPWTYLGHARLVDVAKRHGVFIQVKPVDFGRVFSVSGGLPLTKRAPQRQAYRFMELKRWREHLGVPLTLEPKYFPYDASLASRVIVAADGTGAGFGMRLAGAILKACWAEDRNMADDREIADVCEEQGLPPGRLIAAALSDEFRKRYDAFTDEAIARNVFGAPTYAYEGELFWGQDRLDFLDRALAASISSG